MTLVQYAKWDRPAAKQCVSSKPSANICLRRYKENFIDTVKPVLSGQSKIDKTKVLKTNGSLMKVEEYF